VTLNEVRLTDRRNKLMKQLEWYKDNYLRTSYNQIWGRGALLSE